MKASQRNSSPSESAIQVAVLRHLQMRGARNIFYFHTPNGGLRSVTEAQRMKHQGLIAGVPDLCIIKSGAAYFLELKAEKGRVSTAQKYIGRKLIEAGATVATAFGLDEALATLERWGILKGRAA